jgi:hypothetical protein
MTGGVRREFEDGRKRWAETAKGPGGEGRPRARRAPRREPGTRGHIVPTPQKGKSDHELL